MNSILNRISYFLGTLTIALIFATYVGNYALETAYSNLSRIYTLGCGLGIVKSRNFSTELTPDEINFCVKAGRTLDSAFRQIPENET